MFFSSYDLSRSRWIRIKEKRMPSSRQKMPPKRILIVHRVVIGRTVEPHEDIKNGLFVAHAGVSGSLIDALLSPVHEVIDLF